MLKAMEYVKKNLGDIIYFLFFFLTWFMFLLPFIEIDGRVYYLSDVLSDFGGATVLYWVIIVLYIVSLCTRITSIIIEKKENIDKKYCYLLNGITLAIVILFMFMFIFAGPIISAMIGMGIEAGETTLSFGVFIFIPILLMILILFIKITKDNKYTVKEICETGVLVALAVVLDQFATIKMHATGGSISFCAVPLFIIGIRYGAFKGAIASSLYFGFITCLLDGYGVQTFPFDYLIAFSGYGFVGLFFNLAEKYIEKKELSNAKTYLIYGSSIVIGSLCAMVMRYVGHTISSVVLYSYTVVEGIIYNTLYVPGAMMISMALTLILLPLTLYINKVFPAYRYKPQEELEAAKNE